ncbi:MAG: hypothetical protein GXP31_17680 [Kiritimatiellaeota bacterium]|nr:hypothetical protein [Kiritimatiellota bacterium]
MTFDEFRAQLGVADPKYDAWEPDWGVSRASFAPERLFFLGPEYVRATCERLCISADIAEAMVAAAAGIRANSALARLAWHLYRRMFETPGLERADVRSWPLPPAQAAPYADLFMALLFLAGVPRIEAFYRRHNLPEEVFLETMTDLELWIREYRRKTGRWGFDELGWLVNHFTGKLFRLGRLQFQFGKFRYDYHAFRRRHDGRVLLLAGAGICVHPAGWAAGGPSPETPSAPYREGPGSIHGWPVAPTGSIVRRELRLDAGAWRRVLKKEDPVLNIHIPAGSPMGFEACGDSFRRALAFFAEFFPDFHYRAFACGSWLLDPQFEDYLPEASNIRKFLREFYLFPLPGAAGGSTLARVLGGPVTNLEEAPRKTSLQRVVVAHLKAGKRWREGGGLLFPEDLNWGHRVYRENETALPPTD